MKRLLLLTVLSLITVFMVACSQGTSSGKQIQIDDVVIAFKDAGLEAENVRDMTKADFGIAPMKSSDAKLITIPSICDDCAGRIFSYDKKDDLEQMKAFYDDLGKESALFFSWTIAHKNILIQFNGNMEESQYNKYKEVLEGL